MSKLILGEYDCVARASMNPRRLRLAHQTPCTEQTAYFLIAVMHQKHFPNEKMPLVRLREPRAGKTKARGWGGMKGGRGYVSLPENAHDESE